MTAMKTCKRCGTEKNLEQFSKHKRCKDGYQGTCLDCTALITKTWYLANTQRKAETDKQYEERNPMRKSASRRLRQQIEPYRVAIEELEHNMRNRYDITLEEYGHMFNDQQGLCKICGHSHIEFARGLVIDHNHVTGYVRGLLCDPCNRAIGYLKENVNTLQSAINYINQDPTK
jgi:hypothetical protein